MFISFRCISASCDLSRYISISVASELLALESSSFNVSISAFFAVMDDSNSTIVRSNSVSRAAELFDCLRSLAISSLFSASKASIAARSSITRCSISAPLSEPPAGATSAPSLARMVRRFSLIRLKVPNSSLIAESRWATVSVVRRWSSSNCL